MTSLQAWLSKPRTTVRIDTSGGWSSAPWANWAKALRRSFAVKQTEDRSRIEVVDRLSLGGKRSLTLISVGGRRLLIGIGEDAAPSITSLDAVRSSSPSRLPARPNRTRNKRRLVRR